MSAPTTRHLPSRLTGALALGLLGALVAVGAPLPVRAAAPTPSAALPTTPAFERSGPGIRVSGGSGRASLTIMVRSRGRPQVSQAALTLASAPLTWPAGMTGTSIRISGGVELFCDARGDATTRLAGAAGFSLTAGLLDLSSGQVVQRWSLPPDFLVCSRATTRTVVRAADLVALGTHTPRTLARLATLGITPDGAAGPSITRGSCTSPLQGWSLPSIELGGLTAGDTYQLVLAVEASAQVLRNHDGAGVEVTIAGITWGLPTA